MQIPLRLHCNARRILCSCMLARVQSSQGPVGSPQQGSIVIQDDKDRHAGKDSIERRFVRKGVAECALLEFWQYFKSDAACQVHAAIGKNPQGHVPGFGAKRIDPEIECFHAYFASAGHRVLRDLFRGITRRFIKYGVARGRIQELVNFSEASSRENLFAGDAAEDLLEILQKRDFPPAPGPEPPSSPLATPSPPPLPSP